MINFKKNRVLLLKALREIVNENIGNASLNIELDEEVSEFLTEVKDKRRFRRMKSIRQELDDFIKETTAESKKSSISE